MKKTLFITAALTVILLGSAKITLADYGCSPGEYGSCPSNQTIMIDKTVGKVVSTGNNTSTVQYVDNLSPNDPRFNAGNTIYFQLKVKNTSSTLESNVKVVDIVPSYIEPAEGPGNYDVNSRTITFYIPQLQANEEKVYTVRMQVVSADKMGAGVACENNKATASVNTAYDEDTAQFCLEKPGQTVTGITQVPSTGASDWIVTLLGSISALSAGILLKKKYN
jgi:uncharacterized repeat protein (TIGR01451 family)